MPGQGHWDGVRPLGRCTGPRLVALPQSHMCVLGVIDRISLYTWRVRMFEGALESLEKDPCRQGHRAGVRLRGRCTVTGPGYGPWAVPPARFGPPWTKTDENERGFLAQHPDG